MVQPKPGLPQCTTHVKEATAVGVELTGDVRERKGSAEQVGTQKYLGVERGELEGEKGGREREREREGEG